MCERRDMTIGLYATNINFLGRIRMCKYIFLKNIRKVPLKVSLKEILSIVDDSENSANIVKVISQIFYKINNDSDNNDILLPLRKRSKRLVIENDTDNKDHSNHQ